MATRVSPDLAVSRGQEVLLDAQVIPDLRDQKASPATVLSAGLEISANLDPKVNAATLDSKAHRAERDLQAKRDTRALLVTFPVLGVPQENAVHPAIWVIRA